MWGFFAGCVRGVVLFHAFVFSDAFVMVLYPCFVTVSHVVCVIFAGRENLFDSVRATSVLCVLWGWAFAVSYMFWSRPRLTLLWPSGSGIPRFSDSGASLQRSLFVACLRAAVGLWSVFNCGMVLSTVYIDRVVCLCPWNCWACLLRVCGNYFETACFSARCFRLLTPFFECAHTREQWNWIWLDELLLLCLDSSTTLQL